MADISSFADLFSQLSPFFQPDRSLPQAGEPASAPSSDSPAAESAFPTSMLSGSPAASYGGPVQASPADGATYSPPAAQMGSRFGMGLSFEFNLSIQQQTTREVTFAQPAPENGGDRAVLRALESASMLYQTGFSSSRGILGSSFGEVREFQAELSYSRTRELSARLDPDLGQRFDSTSRRVSRTFELDISLEVSFLGQFARQSDEVSSLDTGLFEDYLRNTDGMAGASGGDLQAFFDDVDRILAETESYLQETLGDFFQGVAETFGLSDDEIGAIQSQASEQIALFFDDVDRFLDDARTALAGFGGAEALPEPEAEAEPAPAIEAAVAAPATAEEETEMALV